MNQPRPFKKQRTTALIKDLAAEFLAREMGPESLVTVMDCSLSTDGNRATIFISVLPVEKEVPALGFAKRKRSELQEYVRAHSKIGRVPMLDFAIDMGEKNRQRIDEILGSEGAGENRTHV